MYSAKPSFSYTCFTTSIRPLPFVNSPNNLLSKFNRSRETQVSPTLPLPNVCTFYCIRSVTCHHPIYYANSITFLKNWFVFFYSFHIPNVLYHIRFKHSNILTLINMATCSICFDPFNASTRKPIQRIFFLDQHIPRHLRQYNYQMK